MYCIFMQFLFSISFETHEIIKSRMVKLTRRDRADVTGADVVIDCML
jgi:hypothetical protein